MKSNAQRRKYTQWLNKHKTSVSVQCTLYTCNCVLQDIDEKLHRYYGLAMQDCGDEKALKCKE